MHKETAQPFWSLRRGSVYTPTHDTHAPHSLGFVLLLTTVAACAAQRPVLYPNAQLTRVGDAAAQRDIDDCMQRAQQYVSSGAATPRRSRRQPGLARRRVRRSVRSVARSPATPAKVPPSVRRPAAPRACCTASSAPRRPIRCTPPSSTAACASAATTRSAGSESAHVRAHRSMDARTPRRSPASPSTTWRRPPTSAPALLDWPARADDPSLTVGFPNLFALLDRHGIRASFFIEGWNGEHHPDAVADIVRRGHELGMHGWTHEAWAQLDADREMELATRATAALERAAGVRPRGFRAPGGARSPQTESILTALGYQLRRQPGRRHAPCPAALGARAGAVRVDRASTASTTCVPSPRDPARRPRHLAARARSQRRRAAACFSSSVTPSLPASTTPGSRRSMRSCAPPSATARHHHDDR